MVKRCITLTLIILLLTSCNNGPKKEIAADNNNVVQTPSITSKNMYDPHSISVGDTFGQMKAKTVSVKDMGENMTVVDIEFESEPIEVTGKFDNYIGDYHVLNFTVDEQSKAKFPIHNLFEYEPRLYFFDEGIFSQFEGYKRGTATIRIHGYHEVVNYKDDIRQNSNFIEIINIAAD